MREPEDVTSPPCPVCGRQAIAVVLSERDLCSCREGHVWDMAGNRMPKHEEMPPERPKVGDRVRLSGRAATGVLRKVRLTRWSYVDWDVPSSGPKITHLYELEREHDAD